MFSGSKPFSVLVGEARGKGQFQDRSIVLDEIRVPEFKGSASSRWRVWTIVKGELRV